MSKPFDSSLLPRTSPIPAKSVTGLSLMGSATKLRCFCEVVDMTLESGAEDEDVEKVDKSTESAKDVLSLRRRFQKFSLFQLKTKICLGNCSGEKQLWLWKMFCD